MTQSPEVRDGFAQQLALLRERMAAGMPRLGWKVGINVPEVQRKLGLSQPLVGWLDGERLFPSGSTLPISQHSKLHVEPELCLRIARPVTATSSLDEALAAVDAIAPALELVDYARPAANLTEVVRGSMFHSATVLGAWRPPVADLDIAARVTLRVDTQEAEAARHDLVPARLADLVLLVARLLAHGAEQLLPGDHILSGSFTAKALPLCAGQTAEAVLGELGVVRCSA